MMHRFFIKTPQWVKLFFPSYVWSLPTTEKVVYLTFDDGPHPDITPFVLEELKKYKAKATFFCIGNNVLLYPQVYQRILAEGHAVGNHTHRHLNGWKVSTQQYLEDIAQAATYIHSPLFRPPYGKIKSRQAKAINKLFQGRAKIIMWDVLSADFDTTISGKACLQHVLAHYSRGSIIVFHDSEKAFSRMKFSLPETLKKLSEGGYQFRSIE